MPEPRVSDERYSVLMAAVERNLMETHGMDGPELIALSAVHANEWTLADLRDVLLDLRDARAELAALKAERRALVEALRHAIHRNHDQSLGCDGCAEGLRVLAEFDKEGRP